MKIRQGFVSNSSSSSFCIYGISISFDEAIENPKLKAALEKVLKKKEEEDGEGLNLDDLSSWDVSEIIEGETGLAVYVPYESYLYIGGDWCTIGDKETGAKFKTKIRRLIKKWFDVPNDKFGTHEEAWRDG